MKGSCERVVNASERVDRHAHNFPNRCSSETGALSLIMILLLTSIFILWDHCRLHSFLASLQHHNISNYKIIYCPQSQRFVRLTFDHGLTNHTCSMTLVGTRLRSFKQMHFGAAQDTLVIVSQGTYSMDWGC